MSKTPAPLCPMGHEMELNLDYFRDGVGYMQAAEAQVCAPTLFDLLEEASGK